MLCLFVLLVHTSQQHIRGVSFADSPRYELALQTGVFSCDGSPIPFALVNDDYCDCKDGSDEPGTSACPNSLFRCPNIGYKEVTLFSSRVNDGICDCCDGSDEWASPSLCVDKCEQVGAKYRHALRIRYETMKKAVETKQQFISQAKTERLRQETEISELSRKIYTQTQLIQEKRAIKEEKEREEAIIRNRKVAEWEAAEELRAIEFEQQQQQQESPQQSEHPQHIPEDPQQPHDHTQHIAKPQHQSCEIVGTDETGIPTQSCSEINENETAQDASSSGVCRWSSSDGGASCDGTSNVQEGPVPESDEKPTNIREPTEVVANQTKPQPHCVMWRQTSECSPSGPREAQHDKLCDVTVPEGSSGYCECSGGETVSFTCDHSEITCNRECAVKLGLEEIVGTEISNQQQFDEARLIAHKCRKSFQGIGGIVRRAFVSVKSMFGWEDECDSLLNTHSAPKFVSKDAEFARAALKQAESERKTLETQLSALQREATQTYGENDEYLMIRDKCLELEVPRYHYTVCLFGDVNQVESGSTTKLGTFEKLENHTMVFTKGTRCWGGPDRSATVRFECGENVRLVSASEPERCVYDFVAESPTACGDLHSEMQKDILVE